MLGSNSRAKARAQEQAAINNKHLGAISAGGGQSGRQQQSHKSGRKSGPTPTYHGRSPRLSLRSANESQGEPTSRHAPGRRLRLVIPARRMPQQRSGRRYTSDQSN